MHYDFANSKELHDLQEKDPLYETQNKLNQASKSIKTVHYVSVSQTSLWHPRCCLQLMFTKLREVVKLSLDES